MILCKSYIIMKVWFYGYSNINSLFINYELYIYKILYSCYENTDFMITLLYSL